MPKWIHDRADHIQAKNPSMPKSEAFAIATQQSHATGHTPKGYGTPTGKHVAKQKFDTPGDDVQTANPKSEKPSTKSKTAFSLAFVKGFSNELSKIANLSKSPMNQIPALSQAISTAQAPPPTGLAQVKQTVPQGSMSTNGKIPKNSRVHSTPPSSPISGHQPVADSPRVQT